MAASDSAPIAALTEGFTFAYLKEAFVATLFSLFQQREAELADGATSNNCAFSTSAFPSTSDDSPSAFRQAFETQVTMLKEQMADEKKPEEKGEKGKKEEEDDEGNKPCTC